MSKTDEAVMQLLVKVEQKKDEIKKLKQKPTWHTNCSFGYENDPDKSKDRVNIQTRRETDLIDFYAFFLQREEYLTRVGSELGIPVELTHLGYSIAEWKSDLKTRLGQLSIEQKQKELEELDKRVNKLVSPDQRREMELKALQAILGEG